MDSIPQEYLTNTILRSCFPQAREIRIAEYEKAENLENVSSDIVRLTVELQEGAEAHDKKLILKIPFPVTKAHRTYCAQLGFYSKEKQMFEVMIPRLRSIPMVSHRLPVHYLTIDECTVVMEDLAFQGYKMVEKGKFFDLEESSQIFKALAEFHAATYKVHQQNPQLLQDSMFNRCMSIEIRQDFMVMWNPVICELFERKNAADMVRQFEAAMRLFEKPDQVVHSKVDPSHFKLVVLNHGDLRKDNMMLKLNAAGQIEGVKFVDFQACWWSTPAYDFLFHLIFSVPVQVVDKQFDDLVDAYWHHLTEALSQLECSVDYRKRDFLSDIEKLQFMFLIWLPARCFFTCPLEHEYLKLMGISKRVDAETIQFCCQSLNDEWFTQSLWGWLLYCEKIKLFDTVGNEARKQENEGRVC